MSRRNYSSRRVDPAFVGMVVGLLAVLLVPGYCMNEAFDIFYYITIFGVLGFIGGKVVAYIGREIRKTELPPDG
jgi:hypothetical protein